MHTEHEPCFITVEYTKIALPFSRCGTEKYTTYAAVQFVWVPASLTLRSGGKVLHNECGGLCALDRPIQVLVMLHPTQN